MLHQKSTSQANSNQQQSDSFTPSPETQDYLNHILCSDPSHFTMIPNFIDHLTYEEFDEETKLTTVKRLSVFAKELYRVLKVFAGEFGKSWACTKTLADTCNMSTGQISKAKKELTQKFHQLNGQPLIIIEHLQKANIKDGNVISKTIYDQITIPSVWHFNKEYYFEKSKSQKEGARSPYERVGGARSQHERATREARSPYERNNIHSNNNPMSNEQQPTAAADPVASEKGKDNVSKAVEFTQEGAYHWMLQYGCHEKLAYKLSRRYPIEEISKASAYLLNKMNNPKFTIKKDKWAYFQDILQKKYWEKTTR